MIGAWMGIGAAESFAVGVMKLSGSFIEIDQRVITAKGKAVFASPDAQIKAEVIRLDLAKGKDGKLAFAKGTASGGVIIDAKQTDKASKTTRDIHATGQTATMVQGENTVVLTGSVEVKVTDPELAEPAVLTGEKVTIYLKERKIQAQRDGGKPAELTVAPKSTGKGGEKT